MKTQSNYFSFLEILKKKIQFQNLKIHDVARIAITSEATIYKRLQGESFFQFDEIVRICRHFHISVDDLVFGNSDWAQFRLSESPVSNTNVYDLLTKLKEHLINWSGFPNGKLYSIYRDLPVFYYMSDPALLAFYIFMYHRIQLPYQKHITTDLALVIENEDILHISQDIWNKFQSLIWIEYWTSEILDTLLNQILFFYEVESISSVSGLHICESIEKLIDRTWNSAHEESRNSQQENFFLHYNRIIPSGNLIRMECDSRTESYMSYNPHEYLSTTNVQLNEQTQLWLETVRSYSYSIGSSGGQWREKLFKMLQDKLKTTKRRMSIAW